MATKPILQTLPKEFVLKLRTAKNVLVVVQGVAMKMANACVKKGGQILTALSLIARDSAPSMVIASRTSVCVMQVG